MPIVRQGIMTSDEAFGRRGTEFWNTIKEMGWKQTPFLNYEIGRASCRERV